MPVITGGWTVDSGYCEILDKTGLINTIFHEGVKEALKRRMVTLETAGTLTSAEKALFDNEPLAIERAKYFIRLDAKWSRFQYMPFADIVSVLADATTWANILKEWA